MEMAKVTSKGQITIPVSIRRRLSINEGDKLLFIDSPDGVVMVNPDKVPAEPGAAAKRSSDKPREPARQKPRNDSVIHTIQDSNIQDESSGAAAVPDIKIAAPFYVRGATDTTYTENTGTDRNKEHEDTQAKPQPRVNGLDVSALLEEIRSIGTNTLK